MSRLPIWIGQHLAAIRAIIVLTLVTGAIYPLAVLGVSQAAFHNAANGSPATYHGTVVGSSLLCQEFTDAKGNPLPQYFQPRPSTASAPDSKAGATTGCDPLYSGASNLGPDNTTLLQEVESGRKAVAAFNGVSPASLPPDALTRSGSGLDPYISPQYAAIQVNRVAKARQLAPDTVRVLVAEYNQGRTIGFLGEPRVNVLLLNIALNIALDKRLDKR